jgi:hypothetical protein
LLLKRGEIVLSSGEYGLRSIDHYTLSLRQSCAHGNGVHVQSGAL